MTFRCLTLVVLLLTQQAMAAESAAPQLETSEGKVEYLTGADAAKAAPAEGEETEAPAGFQLQGRVQVDEKGAAAVRFSDGSRVLLGAGARARVGLTSEGAPALVVDQGDTRIQVPPAATTDADKKEGEKPKGVVRPFRFMVRTRSAVMGVRGTDFVVTQALQGAQSSVHTLEGVVTTAANPAALQAGQGAAIAAGQTVSATAQGLSAVTAFDKAAFIQELAARNPAMQAISRSLGAPTPPSAPSAPSGGAPSLPGGPGFGLPGSGGGSDETSDGGNKAATEEAAKQAAEAAKISAEEEQRAREHSKDLEAPQEQKKDEARCAFPCPKLFQFQFSIMNVKEAAFSTVQPEIGWTPQLQLAPGFLDLSLRPLVAYAPFHPDYGLGQGGSLLTVGIHLSMKLLTFCLEPGVEFMQRKLGSEAGTWQATPTIAAGIPLKLLVVDRLLVSVGFNHGLGPIPPQVPAAPPLETVVLKGTVVLKIF
ncbi:MAG TPA: FecR family protein [Bdellovibrionota bacterium]|jgi:hypothetical protein|nr:FecR family protein [Bdellovibrionota bacterium]